MSAPTRQRLGFIGAGMMAEALMGGMDAAGTVKYTSMGCFDPYKPSREKAAAKGVKVFESSTELVQNSEAIFLAVKPNIIPTVCSDIHGSVKSDNLVISIAAGISLAKLESMLPPGSRVVRVMPNTPCLISEGASGYARGSCATEEDMKFVGKLLSSIGYAVQVKKEEDLHAVTGVSGSGPAYVFQFIEALADGGVRNGLDRKTAYALAAQTVKGAAMMVQQTGKHPGELKDMVTSPAGTTIAAVEALEKGNFRATAMSAVSAAANKSRELAGEKASL